MFPTVDPSLPPGEENLPPGSTPYKALPLPLPGGLADMQSNATTSTPFRRNRSVPGRRFPAGPGGPCFSSMLASHGGARAVDSPAGLFNSGNEWLHGEINKIT